MGKQKHAKPEEHLLGIIRQQEKQIRRLRQRIKQLERYENNNIKERPEKHKEGNCPSCGKGILKEIELVGRIIDSCSLCGWRSKTRKAK